MLQIVVSSHFETGATTLESLIQAFGCHIIELENGVPIV
jgi:hypothetical protein